MNNQSRNQGYFPASFVRRSQRVVISDQGFHYRIRKGRAVGPFNTEMDANVALSHYLKSTQAKLSA